MFDSNKTCITKHIHMGKPLLVTQVIIGIVKCIQFNDHLKYFNHDNGKL